MGVNVILQRAEGQSVRDEATPASDVDLLVVLDHDHAANRHAAAATIKRRLARAPLAIDILVTTPADIAEAGDDSGRVLYHAL